MAFKLLTERINRIKDSVVENGTMKIRGTMMVGGVVNKNNRIYTESVLDRAVEKIMPSVKSRSCFGELNHPPTNVIDLERASHLITSLYKEKTNGGNVVNWLGEAELIVANPTGKIVKNLIEAKANIGFSSRGLGKIEEVYHSGKNINRVNEYHIVTPSDIVANPSAPGTELIAEMVLENDQDLWGIYENSNYGEKYDGQGVLYGCHYSQVKDEAGNIRWKKFLEKTQENLRTLKAEALRDAKQNAFIKILEEINKGGRK